MSGLIRNIQPLGEFFSNELDTGLASGCIDSMGSIG